MFFQNRNISPNKHFSTFLDLQIRGVHYDFLGFDNELNNVQQTATLDFFNPKIGATYSFSNNWLAYSFLGIGHREPNRDDFTQSTPDSRPHAEQMLDLETGLRRTGEKWTASANFFWMHYPRSTGAGWTNQRRRGLYSYQCAG